MSNASFKYTIGFVLEQTLGHVTHSANLQRNVPSDPSVRTLWALIPWEADGLSRRVPLVRSNWTVRAGIAARRAVRDFQSQAKLDALFIHTQVPAILLPDKLSAIPSVVSLDATPRQYDALGAFYDHEPSAGWLEQRKHWLHSICLRRARHLVTWSRWAADSLIKDYGIAEDKITVIPPGVNVSEWQQRNQSEIHNTVDNNTVRILFVGGNFQRKGGQHLLDAVRSLRTQLAVNGSKIHVELHLVTRADVAVEPGVFVYRTMQPNSTELKALFQSCDIFCLPTLGDCLPMVLSEAGAVGKPLVATDVGAINEIVRDGDTGVLVAPGNTGELVVALRTLVEQPTLRLQMGMNAMQLVRQQYDSTRNTTRLLDVIRQVIHERQPALHSAVPGTQIGR